MIAGGTRGGGFALFGLLVGLLAGGAIYGIGEYWIDLKGETPLPLTILFAVSAFASSLLLLAERGARLKALLPAALIASFLSWPTCYMLTETIGQTNLTPWPSLFWFTIGAPLSALLMLTLAKAILLDKFPPPYSSVFFHGLTLPLIAAGAQIFAVLALVLLFAWAGLLRAMDVDFFHRLFQEPWFLLPFLGAVGGISIAMMRSLDSVLGALRFILLLLCRILMPITALFSATFIGVIGVNGLDTIFSQAYPGAIMLALAFAGMLVFNGVYQNGQGEPPPLWLRFASIVSLLAFPVYAGLAVYALWERISDYGLTPARVIGLAMSALAALYSVVCAAGLLTELNWRAKRWMPMVAPLNSLMAGIWIAVLLALATPLANPWALSAKDQERVLLSGAVDAAKFDYGYLRFKLGDYGRAALDRLAAIENHPRAAEIRTRAKQALAANDPYAHAMTTPALSDTPETAAATMSEDALNLPINPEIGPELDDAPGGNSP